MPLLNLPTKNPRARRHPSLPELPHLPVVRDDRSLRIALVTEYYYPHLGGVCEHVHFFAREARRRGHHVDVITSHIPGAADQPHVIRLGRSQPVYCNGSQARITVGLGLRRQLRGVLRRGSYDIVHVHSPLTPVLPLLAIEEAESPVVGTFHTYFDRSVGYTIGRRYFQKRLDMLSTAIAVSHSTTVALDRYFDANWKIIPNGIDTDVFNPSAPLPRGFPRDVPTILFLGRFDPRNGLSTLIDAFRHVKGSVRDAKLVVVGDGPLRDHYYRVAGGDPDILFVGAVLEGRPSYYAHSSVYACPTTKASFGITLLESMACGTPLVVSDITGFRELIAGGAEAVLVPKDNPLAWAHATNALIEDPARRAVMGAAGLAKAAQFAWPRIAERVLEVYRRVKK